MLKSYKKSILQKKKYDNSDIVETTSKNGKVYYYTDDKGYNWYNPSMNKDVNKKKSRVFDGKTFYRSK